VTERPPTRRPLPRPDHYTQTAPFWAAAKDHRLLIQYCVDTGQPQWFPRSASLVTGRRNLEWRPVSGRGTVYSWTVARRGWPGHENRVPYVCALVELDEGVRMLANLLNVEPDGVRIGMPVAVCWERLSDEFEYPAFEPA
jgi:uncharacterized OB-fold protein